MSSIFSIYDKVLFKMDISGWYFSPSSLSLEVLTDKRHAELRGHDFIALSQTVERKPKTKKTAAAARYMLTV